MSTALPLGAGRQGPA